MKFPPPPPQDPPFIYVDKSKQGNLAFSGFLVDLWRIVGQELNLTYQLLPPAPGGFGALHPNGTWMGMVGQVADKVRTRA